MLVGEKNLSNKEKCSGCTACIFSCPFGALEKTYDEKGFAYPMRNIQKCVNCGLCLKVCDFKKPASKTSKYNMNFYATQNKNTSILERSQSGGFFSVLCDYVLSKNGVVCGCEMRDKETICHSIVGDRINISKFSGSKYAQSELNNIFIQCTQILKNGQYLLFSGTPCQVHGFLSFCNVFNIPTGSLVTCDIVCHGCPSVDLWRNYIKEVEKRFKKNVKNFNFRNKKYGWESHIETVLFDDDTEFQIPHKNNFYNNAMFRDSCYECKYTSIYRDTDFTIGDCWGLNKQDKSFTYRRGVSLSIVRTEKAHEIFEKIKCDVIFKEIDIEEALQPQLTRPSLKPQFFDKFWKLYGKNKMKAIEKYFFPSFINRVELLFLRVINKIKKFLVKFPKTKNHIAN